MIVDDIEGFQEEALKIFAAGNKNLKALFIATCRDPWAFPLKSVAPGLASASSSSERGKRCTPSPPGSSSPCHRPRWVSPSGCARCARVGHVDFRQVKIACEYGIPPHASIVNEEDIFTRTRKPLRGRIDFHDDYYLVNALCDSATYGSHAGFFHNLHSLGSVDDASRWLNTMSLADSAPNEETKTVALSQFFAKAPSVGALPYPKASTMQGQAKGVDFFSALA